MYSLSWYEAASTADARQGLFLVYFRPHSSHIEVIVCIFQPTLGIQTDTFAEIMLRGGVALHTLTTTIETGQAGHLDRNSLHRDGIVGTRDTERIDSCRLQRYVSCPLGDLRGCLGEQQLLSIDRQIVASSDQAMAFKNLLPDKYSSHSSRRKHHRLQTSEAVVLVPEPNDAVWSVYLLRAHDRLGLEGDSVQFPFRVEEARFHLQCRRRKS